MKPPSRDDRDTEPDGVPTSDDVTIARCRKCGKRAINAGPTGTIVPDEEMVRRRWRVCCFGPNWSWCDTPPKQFTVV